MHFSPETSDDEYYVDPPSPAHVPELSDKTFLNGRRKQRAEIVATRSMPDTDVTIPQDSEEGVPHQWTTKQVKTLIQIRLSDSIDLKFRTTKKSHKHIWLAVSKKLKSVGIAVDHVQSQSKFNKVRREYAKRYQKVNKSGADRTLLYNWEFYHDLEPSFRNCRQIAPDHVECSRPLPSAEDAPLEETGDNSSHTDTTPVTPQSSGLVFPNRRKKRPLTQEDRDDLADKRFKQWVDELQKTDKLLAQYTETYQKTAEAQTKFYKNQAETATAQSNYYKIKAELAAAKLSALQQSGSSRR